MAFIGVWHQAIGELQFEAPVLFQAIGELRVVGSGFASSYWGTTLVRVLLCFKQATAGLRFGGSCFVFSSVLHCVNLLGNSNFPGPALRQAIGEYRQIRRVHPCATVSDNIGNKPASKAQAAIRVVLHWSSAHRLGNQRRTNQRSTPTGDSMQSIGNMCRSSDTVQGSSWIASQTQESQVSSGRHCSHQHQLRQCQNTVS